MKVGDLVKCKTVDAKGYGIITEVHAPKPGTTGRWFFVLYSDWDRSYPFRAGQLEVM